MHDQNQPQAHLERRLTFMDTFSMVVGGVIGTGVFIKAATMTQTVGSVSYVMAAWFVAGILSLSGALVYAEIGGLYPHAGGEYVYLRESFGTFSAYLYGWTRVLIASPATLAAYAAGGAIFLNSAVDLTPVGGIKVVACVFIIFFTVTSCLEVGVGGKLQTILTIIKILVVIGVAFFLFSSSKGSTTNFSTGDHAGWPGISAFGVAMVAALWAYDGWNNMPMIAGEVKNPQRNVPLSLIFGMFACLILYCVVNLSYYYILPVPEIMNANSDSFPNALPAATKAIQYLTGPSAVKFMSFMFTISALGALNGSTMSFARVPFAMARDGLFFKFFGSINAKTHVPVKSAIIQGIISCIFVAWLDFDKLTNYVIFSSWIFYGLVTSSIFYFRKKHGVNHESYKTWGYPILPIVFIVVAIFLVINTIYASPKDSMIGLAIIAAGIPLYFFFRKNKLGQSENVS